MVQFFIGFIVGICTSGVAFFAWCLCRAASLYEQENEWEDT